MKAPRCPKHGRMARRAPGTEEQKWCGTWFECSDLNCKSAVLFPSAALKALLAQKATVRS